MKRHGEIPQYKIYVKYTFLLPLYVLTQRLVKAPFELKNCGSLLTVHLMCWQVVRPWTHYLPTGLDNLPAATAHTNTRL